MLSFLVLSHPKMELMSSEREKKEILKTKSVSTKHIVVLHKKNSKHCFGSTEKVCEEEQVIGALHV